MKNSAAGSAVPESPRPYTGPTPVEDDTAFELAVRDILTEHQLSEGLLTNDQIETLAEQVMAAYRPRITLERTRVAAGRQQIRALQGRAQGLGQHLAQLHETNAQMLVSRDRYGAQVRSLVEQVSEIGAVVRAAAEAGQHMVHLGELSAILQTPRLYPPQRGPVMMTIVPAAADRWTSGLFHTPGGDQLHQLLGWAVIARGRERDTLIEPVFNVDGTALSQSQCTEQGLILDHLL